MREARDTGGARRSPQPLVADRDLVEVQDHAFGAVFEGDHTGVAGGVEPGALEEGPGGEVDGFAVDEA